MGGKHAGGIWQDASWETIAHEEKAAFLERVFTVEETEVAFGTVEEDEMPQVEGHIRASRIAPRSKLERKPIRQASEDYLQIIRAHYMKIILQSIRNVQQYAGTPNATVYIHKILHTIRDFEDKSPDDALLEVLFAFYDAFAYENKWATYSSVQFKKAEEILNQVTEKSIRSKNIEKAIAALDCAGFDIIPFQFSLEDDTAVL